MPTNRLPCIHCGELILTTTAERTGGLCMPCKGGYRESIEEGKRQAILNRERHESASARHWRALVQRAFATAEGFKSLTPEEQTYYAVCLLEGEVYNGGFEQYFTNSSADCCAKAVEGLTELGASDSLRILLQAKALLFGAHSVPIAQAERLKAPHHVLVETPESRELLSRVYALDKEFYAGSAGLLDSLERYAERHELRKGS